MKHSSQEPGAPRGFETLPLSPDLLNVIRELGYEAMTPVQAESIPLLLTGRDLIAQSQTGSGKTAAFSLPILAGLQLSGRRLQALILCPTRELCTQVAREIRKLGRRHAGLQVLLLCGGQPFRPQAFALERGVHVVVATPGRLVDHLSRNTISLEHVSFLILDEADRMLDMGFEEDMTTILAGLPPKRQTAFFSATFPHSIAAMSKAHQQSPAKVVIESSDRPGQVIRQLAYDAENESKPNALLWLIEELEPASAIVFCNQKATVTDLTGILSRAGVSSDCLHGDLEQRDRDKVMALFRNGSVRILVATDVAARGIDVESLDAVFNYDLPSKPDVYVHRIGRTGRAGKSGLAISLVTARDEARVRLIESFIDARLEKKRLGEIGKTPKKTAHAEAAMTTLRIGAGRKEKLRPGDILGALTGEAGGLSADQVGKIEIHDHFAYVAVATGIAKLALKSLQAGRIKGRKISVEMV